MSLKVSLVLTTINDPELLENYFENFRKYDHLDQVKVFCIPDKKTPEKAYKRCADLQSRGFDIICPTLKEQDDFLDRLEFPPYLIPYNSDNRRNIGYLMALDAGTDFLISIDDDNYCTMDEDVFIKHAIVCDSEKKQKVINSDIGWYNICELLEYNYDFTPHPRGYPYYARHLEKKSSVATNLVNVVINEGLWLGDPDVDAISWLVKPVIGKKFKGKSVILGENTWCPINTQNTSLHMDLIPCFYYIRMGYNINGIDIDHFGDIFSGYFVQACVKHLGGHIRFGNPIALHRRNSHNYMKDAHSEWMCILLLNDLLPWLTNEIKLEGNNYIDSFNSLSYCLQDVVEQFTGSIWTDSTKAYFHQIAHYMRQWTKVCDRIIR